MHYYVSLSDDFLLMWFYKKLYKLLGSVQYLYSDWFLDNT